MKPLKFSFFILFLLVNTFVFSFAQSPQKVSYQSVIRDASGELVRSQTVGMQISILQGSVSGTAVYVETHTPATNVNGLASVEVGNGTPVSDTFSDIDWENGPYFLKVETDPAGGTTYTIVGTTEILSVPYALHAKTAETATGTLLDRIEALEEAILIINGFTDPRDNNHYNVVKIGDQVWMAENLKYLPSVNYVADGSEDSAGSYYYVYDYDGTDVNAAKATSNYTTYGVLYNWTAAMDSSASSTANPSGVQGVCPTGWHLPSDAEWTQIVDYLGGRGIAGNELKEAGTIHWASPNTGATNGTGFTALPGGRRWYLSTFNFIGETGHWWSATDFNTYHAWYRRLEYYGSIVSIETGYQELGYSVRCLRN